MELRLPKGQRLVVRLTAGEAPGPPPGGVSMADQATIGTRRDLVREHSRKLAACLIVVAVALLIGSLSYGVRQGLPSVALDWLFGLQLLRAGVAFVIVAILTMLILRGWGGLWPERILTTGVEFPAAEKEVEQGLTESAKISLDLLREIQSLRTTEPGE